MKLPSHIAASVTAALATAAVMLPALAGPLGWLPVLLHEGAHGLVAVATGSSEVQITLTHNGGGHFRSRGGAPSLVWGAGYVGGPLFALAASRLSQRWPGTALAGLSVVTASATLLWLPYRDPISLGLLLSAGLLGGLALGLSRERAAHLEPLVVLYLCAYGLADVIFDAWHAAPHLPSDGAQLAAAWGVPAWCFFATWALLVLCISKAATEQHPSSAHA